MKISNRLETILLNRSFPYRDVMYSHRKSHIQDGDVNTRLLHTINDGDTFIVPASILFKFVQENSTSSNVVNIVNPLSITIPYNVKTLDSMVTSILQYNMRKDHEIAKVVSEKYGTYYGTEGMILDSDFNILLLNACKCTVEEGHIQVKECIVYVNPIVSLADTGMDKHIYTKILPTYLNNPIYHNIPPELIRHRAFYVIPTIIFKNVTNTFLTKPIEPSDTMNEDIHNILDNSIDELLEVVVKCQ